MTLHFLASQNAQEVMFLSQCVRLCWLTLLMWFWQVRIPITSTDMLWVNFPSLTFIIQPFSCPSLTALWHLYDGSSKSTIYPCEDKSFCPSKYEQGQIPTCVSGNGNEVNQDADHLKIFIENTILALACPTFRCSLPKVI